MIPRDSFFWDPKLPAAKFIDVFSGFTFWTRYLDIYTAAWSISIIFSRDIILLNHDGIVFSLFASLGSEFKSDILLQPNVKHSNSQFPTVVYWNFTPAHYVTELFTKANHLIAGLQHLGIVCPLQKLTCIIVIYTRPYWRRLAPKFHGELILICWQGVILPYHAWSSWGGIAKNTWIDMKSWYTRKPWKCVKPRFPAIPPWRSPWNPSEKKCNTTFPLISGRQAFFPRIFAGPSELVNPATFFCVMFPCRQQKDSPLHFEKPPFTSKRKNNNRWMARLQPSQVDKAVTIYGQLNKQ